MITKKFRVAGKATITIEKVVEVTFDENDEDFQNGDGTIDEDAVKGAAIDMANENFGGIGEFVGNGGIDKLIGVYESDESIHGDGEPEFDSAEEIP